MSYNHSEYILLSLVLSSFLVTSVFVPTMVGYLFVTVVFAVSLLWLNLIGKMKFTLYRSVLWSYLSVVLLFVFGTVWNPSIRGFMRLGIFIGVTSVILFSIVHTVNFKKFWRLYGLFTAVIVLIGSPTVFIDQVSLGPVVISSYGTAPPTPLNAGINVVSSIFNNPNNFGLVCSFAATGLIVTQEPSRYINILTLVNVFGVFISDGQSAQLALIAGIGIFAVGQFNRSVVPLVTVTALGTITTGLLMAFQLLPGPETLSAISLSGRRHLWWASVQALEVRPWIGYGTVNMAEVLRTYISDPLRLGAGPHNSYIRIALSAGVIGLISYVYLHLYALFQSAKQSSHDTLAPHAMLWSAIIIQLFNGATMFGISSSSILFTIVLGWSLRELSID